MKKVQVIDKLWICPICFKKHGLESIAINNGMFNKSSYIKCSSCGTEFDVIFNNGKIDSLKLKNEGARHSPAFTVGNTYSIDDLREQFLSNLALDELNIQTPFILSKDEKIFFCDHIDRKSFVKKTETVMAKDKKIISLSSIFSLKNNPGNSQNYQPIQQTKEIFEKVDSGNFIVTDKRIAFAGKKLTISIDLEDILSIYLDEDYNIVLGTNDGQLFLDSEKPVKNEIIDIIKFLRK